jgi:hypothetical protein
MNDSSPIPDDTSEEDLRRLVAEALDAILTVEWHEGRLHLRLATAKKSQARAATPSTTS